MEILLVEPFYTSSHKKWADGLVKYSKHNIHLLTMPGRYWKWRMHGAAVTLSKKLHNTHETFDCILCTDMLDIAVFRSLLPKIFLEVPLILYFHENQLTYPWSGNDKDIFLGRDAHYAWINYTSALCADTIVFNSHYHKSSFIEALKVFLKKYPDGIHLDTIKVIENKSRIIGIGIEKNRNYFSSFNTPRTIIWNHRWEYDKNPSSFFNTLFKLKNEGIEFHLNVIGQSYSRQPEIFTIAKKLLKDEIINWGFVSKNNYAKILEQSDVIPITSNQDFFGIGLIEAMYNGCLPILPNRLVYPEHVSKQYHYLYNNELELYEQLKSTLTSTPTYSKKEIRTMASKYTWDNIIEKYDSLFNNLRQNTV